MAKVIAAISGGVDSVVLLDMLSKGGDHIIVAHVEHGIRDDSADDARFVRALAKKYGYQYEEASLHLGEGASELAAREARYAFLFSLAARHKATIVAAHHGDDLAETVAINLHRGTGWRGLAVLNRQGIKRPLLPYSKADLYEYALRHGLEWVEDKTNQDQRYLRNHIRSQLRPRLCADARKELFELRNAQVKIASAISTEVHDILSQSKSLRYLMTHVDADSALELLGSVLFDAAGVRPRRPQLERALIAIKTAQAGAIYHVGDKIILRFTTRDFSVEVLQ